MFASSTLVQVLYSLPIFRDYINKLRPPVKGVAMKVKKLFSKMETSSDPVRTSNYVRHLGLQHYEPGIQSAFRGFKQCSNNKWDVTSVNGSKGGEYLENYR